MISSVRSTISAVATIMNAQRNPNAACNTRKPMLLAMRASERSLALSGGLSASRVVPISWLNETIWSPRARR